MLFNNSTRPFTLNVLFKYSMGLSFVDFHSIALILKVIPPTNNCVSIVIIKTGSPITNETRKTL